jgi:hypothetical protein
MARSGLMATRVSQCDSAKSKKSHELKTKVSCQSTVIELLSISTQSVRISECFLTGVALMEVFVGFDRVIMIEAIAVNPKFQLVKWSRGVNSERLDNGCAYMNGSFIPLYSFLH